MDEYIDVKIDVFENVGQRARLRRTLTVSALVEEILREFNDIAADSPEKYAVYLKGVDRPFNPAQTMLQLDIQPQDELVFGYVHQMIRKMFTPEQVAYLREELTGKVFELLWQPAVIGRPTNEADHNLSLAVNVQSLPEGMTISRKHAQVTFSDGRHFIEALSENNPVLVNNKEVPVNGRRELRNGDKIVLGQNKLTLLFSTKKPGDGARTDPVAAQSARAEVRPAVRVEAERVRYVPGGSQVAFLVVEKAAQAERVGTRIDLVSLPFLLGRDLPGLLGESDVSRRHAEISFDAASGQFFVTDLQSTNGSSVDGAPLAPNQPRELGHGSRLGLGPKVVLRLEF